MNISDLPELWQQKVKVTPAGCWEWTACHDQKGYATATLNRRSLRVSRYVLSLKLERPLAPRMQACHTCDNPPCICPDHLYEGTQRQNHADKVARGRSPRGERNGRARLSSGQVINIREQRATGIKPGRLALRYGVTRHQITEICAGRSWQPQTSPPPAGGEQEINETQEIQQA